RPDRARTRRRFPTHLDRPAVRAHGAGREAPASARATGRHKQLATRGAGPERRSVPVGLEVWKEKSGDSHRQFLKSNELVGTPSPLVTRQQSARSTWLVDVPRICRTPSSTRLKPCT